MLRSVVTLQAIGLAGALGLLASGCGKSKIRTYESQACSTNESDDPLLVCSPAYDLICINTYGVAVTDPNEAKNWDGGIRPVYVCRIACASDSECFQAGDVCCPGVIHGITYQGKKAGCAPPGNCDYLGTTMDAGADAQGNVDAPNGPNGGQDGGAADSPGADAAADAATDRAGDAGAPADAAGGG